MKKNKKKIIANIIAAGGISTGTLFISDKIDCDYEFKLEGETICLSEKELQVLEGGIGNQSFEALGDLTF